MVGSTLSIVMAIVIVFAILENGRKRRAEAAALWIKPPREAKTTPAKRIGLAAIVLIVIAYPFVPAVVGPIVARQKLGPKGQERPIAEVVGWGAAFDQDGDCLIEGKETALSIKVPGTLHDLSVEHARVNAPRVLRTVEGDFIAEVKIVGQVSPQGVGTSDYALPYHGAGLLLWLDRDNYIRLERAAILQETGLFSYVNFEQRASAAMYSTVGEPTPDGSLSLRLVRRGTSVSAAYRLEGQDWIELPKQVSVKGWGDSLRIGVAATNTAAMPFIAEFLDYRVDKL